MKDSWKANLALCEAQAKHSGLESKSTTLLETNVLTSAEAIREAELATDKKKDQNRPQFKVPKPGPAGAERILVLASSCHCKAAIIFLYSCVMLATRLYHSGFRPIHGPVKLP